MPIPIFGGPGGVPFDRTFFNVTLGDLLGRDGKDRPQKLTLFLADGTTLEVCTIDQMADSYLALHAYGREAEACDMSEHLIPYGIIYRIELSPKGGEEGGRVGFHWEPAARKAAARKTSRRPVGDDSASKA